MFRKELSYYPMYKRSINDMQRVIGQMGIMYLEELGFDVVKISNRNEKSIVYHVSFKEMISKDRKAINSVYLPKQLPTFLHRGCVDPNGWPTFLAEITKDLLIGTDHVIVLPDNRFCIIRLLKESNKFVIFSTKRIGFVERINVKNKKYLDFLGGKRNVDLYNRKETDGFIEELHELGKFL